MSTLYPAVQQATMDGLYEGSGMNLPPIPQMPPLGNPMMLNGIHPIGLDVGGANPASPEKPPMSLQDWLALSYLTTGLGGAVGQAFKKGVPPPPIGLPQTSPPPPTTPTATQAALGMANTRKQDRARFGRG